MAASSGRPARRASGRPVGALQGAMDRIPESTAALPLQTLDGGPVPFGRLWQERPVVVVFLRHFG